MDIKGTIQSKKGYLYAVIMYFDEAGKKKYKWYSTGLKERGNRKEAKEILNLKMEEFEAEQQAKRDKLIRRTKPKEVDKSDATMLFSDYCKKYVESKKHELSPSVYHTYHGHYIKVFKDFFDARNLRLIDITDQEIKDFYEDRLKHGIKKVTLKHYNCVLRPALRQAYRDKLIPDNPFDYIESIKKEKSVMSYYDKDEMKLLLSAIKGHKLEVPFTLAAYYGFRRSEVLGMRWSAIDFEHKFISVNHKMLLVERQQYFDDELKTKTSERTLPLIPAVEQVLLRHKAQIEENKKFYGNAYDIRYLDYVCVEENGKIVYPDYMSKQFSKLLKANNLRHIRLHDLRHSCASNLLASGVPLKEIQEWLGHANFSTTADVYSHLDFSAKVKAGNLISAAYGDDKPVETVTEQLQVAEQDTMAIFAQAIKEMQELGFEKLDDYLAYKESEALKSHKKKPPTM